MRFDKTQHVMSRCMGRYFCVCAAHNQPFDRDDALLLHTV